MNQKPVVVDRGIDEVLIINGEVINIGYLSGKKLISLLNNYNLTDIQLVSFNEYEKSNDYPKATL